MPYRYYHYHPKFASVDVFLLSQYFLYLLIRYKNLPKHFSFKKFLLQWTQAHQISNIIFAMNANIIVTQKDALHASNSSTTCLRWKWHPHPFWDLECVIWRMLLTSRQTHAWFFVREMCFINKTLIQNSPFWPILKTRWFNPHILKIN